MMVSRKEAMALARAAKTGKPPASRIDMTIRAARAVALLVDHRRVQVHMMLMEEFGVCADSADRIIKKAYAEMKATAAQERETHVALALEQIEDAVRAESGDVRLRAIKLKMDLLGLAAPVRSESEVNLTAKAYDPKALDAMRDPAVRAKAIELENAISDFEE